MTAGLKRARLVTKPMAGHYAKAKVEGGRGLWELRVQPDKIGDFTVGGEIKADIFEVGHDYVLVEATPDEAMHALEDQA